MRERARAIHAQGGLAPAQGFKEYDPGDLVKARLQLSTGGWLRGREAGVDVMGDGALVPYAGAYGRHRLEPASGDDAFETVRSALT